MSTVVAECCLIGLFQNPNRHSNNPSIEAIQKGSRFSPKCEISIEGGRGGHCQFGLSGPSSCVPHTVKVAVKELNWSKELKILT